jgi:hypothetical protein
MKKQNGADQTCAISWPEIELEMGFSTASTLDVTGRQKAKLFDGPVDGIVGRHTRLEFSNGKFH